MRSSALILTLTTTLAVAEEKRAQTSVSIVPDEPLTDRISLTAGPFTPLPSLRPTQSSTFEDDFEDDFPTSTSTTTGRGSFSFRGPTSTPRSSWSDHHTGSDHGGHSTTSKGLWGSGNGTSSRKPSGTGAVGGGEVTTVVTTSAGGGGSATSSSAAGPSSTTRPAAAGRLERSLGVAVALGAVVGVVVML